MAKKRKEINMVDGPLWSGIIRFAIPLIFSGFIQLLFNASDIIVVGKFSGEHALAAVGATSTLTSLLVNLFVGMSVGANVVMGRYCGSHNYRGANEVVNTAIATALWGGVAMAGLGIVVSGPLLSMMGTPSNVIGDSTLYMRIYFLCMPGFMVYNFGASLFRAIGDTKRPLMFLSISGVIKLILNLLFVIVFKMGVAGVAIATIISQFIAAGFIILSFESSYDFMKIKIRKLSFHKDKFREIIRIGLPAGLQSIVFNISNVLIQSSVNSFGFAAIAGNTAANNIEGFVYTGMNAFYQASLSFTSQNMGAKRYHRIDKILLICLILVAIIGTVTGVGAYLIGTPLASIYSDTPEVINYALTRLSIVSTFYAICGLMDTFVGSIRGLGYSIMPMIVSLMGACLFRVIWIFTIFQNDRTLTTLYISYPISWILTTLSHALCYMIVRRKKLNPKPILELEAESNTNL